MFNKKLAAVAAVSALMATFGAAVAQSTDATDPMATPQQVDVTTTPSNGNQIYFFRDQGNSPETDPAAHLNLIKHERMAPVAMDTSSTTTTTTTTTTVADATPAVTTMAPSAADTSNTESTDTAMPADDTTPALAPRADRN